MAETALIGLDWGTTSLRAFRFGRHGGIIARRRADRGIMKVEGGQFAAALDDAIGDWRAEAPQAPILMAGMIGSRQGWVEAPYAACPADAASLAGALTAVPSVAQAYIVPGVAWRNGIAAPEVMRGEETQIVGLGPLSNRLVVLPGTHSKWVWLDAEGRMARFTTFMTGEVFDVMRRHSILGRLMPGSEIAPAADGFERGLDEALSPDGPGTLQSLFSARARGLFGELPADQLSGYLSGLLIGAELKEGRQAIAHWGGVMGAPILVGGGALVTLYTLAFARLGLQVETADEDAGAHGLWAIAAKTGTV
jgi:2-dehydro-3-deoxygalactonokinase